MIGIGGIALFLNSLFSLLNCIYLFIHSAAQHGMWKPSSPTKDKIPYPLHWKLRSPSDRDLNPGSLAPASINLIYYPTLRLGTILSESPSSTKGEFRAVLRGSKCSQCQGQSRLQGRGENSVFLKPNVNLSPLQLQQVQSGLVYPRPPPIPASPFFKIPICSVFHSSSQGP